ncbi:MAG: transcriptional regulator, LysR family [Actinomycetia bacterium]|jgi:DNA-binding transcriptional LysR family regulator|nr:transcriptional regulator, LysR family [Actinomycetes bacterium]
MELRTLRYFVAVAEELHFGRAAARLHMSQPPLSRAIQRLETDLGIALLHRSSAGVALTPAGATMLDEARTLLRQADQMRVRMAALAGTGTITIGMLADSADPGAMRLAAAYRREHPDVEVRIRETDLTDPTCGLRAGLVDVALTRGRSTRRA